MRTLVIVSRDKSDIFFANQLARNLNVVGIVVENQTPEQDQSSLARKALKYAGTPRLFFRKVLEDMDRRFIEPSQPYNQRGNALDFGEEGRVLMADKGIEILHTQGVNAINEPEYQDWIRNRNPDLIAVCGASILKRDLLGIPPHGVLNLHGGLSQFYRGLFTTDWAIHNREPECVGATVHFVSEGVDDGDIVYQGRPDIEANDHPNSLYEKVVRLGVNMMMQAVRDIEHSRCKASKLESRGRLYLNERFDVSAKRETWRQIERGVIPEYLSNKAERDQRITGSLINDFNKIAAEVNRSA